MKRLTLTAALLLLFALAPSAQAAFDLNNFKVTYTNAEGETLTRAGSHPFAMSTSFSLNTEVVEGKEFPVESIKDLVLAQIEGFAGDQSAVPKCSTLDFLTKLAPALPNCADSSAIGIASVTIGTGDGKGTRLGPIYNLEPAPGSVAKIGFWIQGVPIAVDVGLTALPPYRLTATTTNTSQVLEVFAAEITLWGVPADPAHDEQRGGCLIANEIVPPPGGIKCPAGVAEAPFLTMPRACLGTLSTDYEVNSWQSPATLISGSSPFGPLGDCGKLGFAPRTDAQPGVRSAESAAGLNFDIEITDEGLKNPKGTADSDIEGVLASLPAGVTLNPSAAEGLGVCTKAQYEAEALETPAGAGCPPAAKVGTIEASTPLLEDHTLRGALYVAAQDDPETAEEGAENPFDSLLALYLVIRDPELGIFIKQAGEVQLGEEAGPLAGRVSTRFDELPQFPLGHVSLRLRQGPRAPLITPPTCATYTTTTALTPYSGAAPLISTSSFAIDSGVGGGPCPTPGSPPFDPGFQAGSENNAAARYSPFYMRLTRADGEADLTRFSVILPPGVTGKIAGLGRCGDQAIEAAKAKSGRAELANPSCPQGSKLGHVLAGAGVGSALTYVPGSLYLAGPFAGDPLSVVAIVPAVAGPFDVGTVITRVALALNPSSGEVEVDGAASDPIPHILKGIPLKVRDLRIYVDRPGVTLNPTSCAVSSARAQITGSGADAFNPADDVAVSKSARYQAADCASLPFAPKLTLSLLGATKRAQHPRLSSLLLPRPGDANIGRAAVVLPNSLGIDNAHINNPCTRVQFNANQCPPSSVLGTARAYTPLLDAPLEGPVYFRSNGGERLLPDVVADLNGEFRVILIGEVDTITPKTNPRLRTTFRTVPDAPVSKFELSLFGGKRGLLVTNSNICRKPQRTKLLLTGQNGRKHNTEPLVKTSCKGKGAKRR